MLSTVPLVPVSTGLDFDLSTSAGIGAQVKLRLAASVILMSPQCSGDRDRRGHVQ